MSASPKWLVIVGVIALLWNLMGAAAVVADALTDRSTLTAAQQALAASMPVWAKAGSWIGVGAGVLGSLGLVLRKTWAVPVLGLSLAGIIAQDVWMFGMADVASAFGSTPLMMQGFVLAIAVALLWLAHSAKGKGWLG